MRHVLQYVIMEDSSGDEDEDLALCAASRMRGVAWPLVRRAWLFALPAGALLCSSGGAPLLRAWRCPAR